MDGERALAAEHDALPDLLVRHRDPGQCHVLPPFPQRDPSRIAQSGTPAQPDARGVPAHRAPVVTGQDPQVLPCVAHSASVLRPQEAPQEGAVSTGGAGPITHELGERPAIADRRERVGEGEGDTVAGRMSGAVLVTPARPGHQVVPGGRQGPLQTRGRRLTAQSSRPWPPTPPPPHRGPGPRVRPRVPPFKNHWAPPSTSARPAAPGSAAQARTPTACCASTSPRGPHWTASTPRGSNRCTINSTNDHANASAGKPLRKPTHTARCTSCEKPSAL